MPEHRKQVAASYVGLGALLAGLAGCESYPFLPFAETNKTTTSGSTTDVLGFGVETNSFQEVQIQSRVFTNGAAVRTAFFAGNDLGRVPRAIDFNRDGLIDPVVAYADISVDSKPAGGVLQILLSKDSGGDVDFTSLTFDGQVDSCKRWSDLRDVAVGDIDGDGLLDLVAATREGVVYLHHPNPLNPETLGKSTTDLRYWGVPGDCSCEFIVGTTETITNDEVQSIVLDRIGLLNVECYDVIVKQLYTRVALGDLDNDGDVDIAASREFEIQFSQRSTCNVPAIDPIMAGGIQILINPGDTATSGCDGWTGITVGQQDRLEPSLDREGPLGLHLADIDGDGDLDIVSASSTDNNVQVAWFANPRLRPCPAPLLDADDWVQWRIGSVRGAFAVDIADLTGDGKPDVVATGRDQQQLVLFAQPSETFCDGTKTPPQPNGRYEYDWDTYVLATFESVVPQDVKALDLDNDGQLELVVGGDAGQLRLFESPGSPTATWSASIIADLIGGGIIGSIGYGDVDADGDLDLVVVSDAEEDNSEAVSWIKNNQ